MPQCHKAFTDYPIDGATGVIEVAMLAYDRNKYVTVQYGNTIEEVKSGYLYLDAGLKQPYGARRLYALPLEVDGTVPTRRQAHAELMGRRRRHQTKYVLWVGEVRHQYRHLHEALRHFGRACDEHNCVLMRNKDNGRTWSSECFVESEDGGLVIPVTGRKRTSLFRTRHRRIGGF